MTTTRLLICLTLVGLCTSLTPRPVSGQYEDCGYCKLYGEQTHTFWQAGGSFWATCLGFRSDGCHMGAYPGHCFEDHYWCEDTAPIPGLDDALETGDEEEALKVMLLALERGDERVFINQKRRAIQVLGCSEDHVQVHLPVTQETLAIAQAAAQQTTEPDT